MAHKVWVTVRVCGVAALPSSTLMRLRSRERGSRSTWASRSRATDPSKRVGSKRLSTGAAPR